MRLPTGMKLVNALLGGWTALMLFVLYVPIAVLFIFSFNKSRLNVRWQGFTLDWYAQLARNDPLLRALKNSLVIATWTTLFSVVLGTMGAWLLYRYRYPASRLLNTLIFVPMVIPEILMGVSLLVFFTTAGMELGFTTVIVSHVTFCFPFVLVAVRARLQGLDPALEEAAMDLGATPATAFRLVILPYLLPSILAGALMSFTLSMDELIVTYFTYSPDSVTLPIRIFGEVKKGLNPMLNAASAVFILATAVLVVLAHSLGRSTRAAAFGGGGISK